MKKIFVFICMVLSLMSCSNVMTLEKGHVRIVLSEESSDPVWLAAESLQRDFEKVMDFKPEISHSVNPAPDVVNIVIVDAGNASDALGEQNTGYESHRVFCDYPSKCIYLYGADMRGTIYAIYTFSEKVLGVPPLWYFCSWKPEMKEKIAIKKDFDVCFDSPQVRYRAWFPNDTDFFTPWRSLSRDNDELWLETMLRLKLNTVEMESSVLFDNYRMKGKALLFKKYGLVLTSHHMIACNTSFNDWPLYWRNIRHMETAPELSVNDLGSLTEFWRYAIETVCENNLENLWQIGFRGIGDQPFWAAFKDAPEDEQERAEVINKMIRIQLEMIKDISGDKDPFVRMTFYDEISDLLAKGYLKPPVGENMLWTFVAGRRDHYPYDDLVGFDTTIPVNLGYYMNFQFTSTGSHIVAAEGPWKMEFNYRYVNSRRPLKFSVVNAGNLREHAMELSANAAMMWDMSAYDSDSFVESFCEQYFSKEKGREIASLYKDYYHAFWNPSPSVFDGMERQFIFHDMRYARVFNQVSERFFDYNDNPLREIGFERIPGRSFRISGNNQVDSLISGTSASEKKFLAVSERADRLANEISPEFRPYFRDMIQAPSHFMTSLNRSMNNFMKAYKDSAGPDAARLMDSAIRDFSEARDFMEQTQEGVFSSWYAKERLFGFERILGDMKKIRKGIEEN